MKSCDRTYIAWNTDERIDDLRGFGTTSRDGGIEKPLNTWVGWEGERVTAGTTKPSSEWPVQKFMWSDLQVSLRERVSYQVAPMTGPKHNLTLPLTSGASGPKR